MNELRTVITRLAKHRRVGPEPATLPVRCRGQTHRILRDRKSQLRLLDHTERDIECELALEQLGGTACRCVEIWQAWYTFLQRGFNYKLLPEGFRDEIRHFRWIRKQRELHERMHRFLPDRPWYQQLGFLGRFLTRLLHDHCGVPEQVEGRCALRKELYDFVLETADRELFREIIRPTWIDDIYRRGLAIVGGTLTLKFLASRQRGEIYLQCRPVPSDDELVIVAERTVIRPAANGVMHEIVERRTVSR